MQGDGIEDGTVLRVGDRTILYVPGCQTYVSMPLSAPGMVLMNASGGSGRCTSPPPPLGRLPGSLDRVEGFSAGDGGTVLLVDRDAATVAVLTPGAIPPTTRGLLPSDPLVPSPSPGDSSRIDRVAVVPTGLIPATRDELVGTWVSERPTNPDALMTFGSDGRYSGTDGCNGVGGRWTWRPGGLFLASSGPMTSIGCANDAVLVSAPSQARSAGFDGDVLVLSDINGSEVGRLVRR